MDRRFIEQNVTELQGEIWTNRSILFPAAIPHPREMLRPEIAAQVAGVGYETHYELRLIRKRSEAVSEVAGLLDRQANKIAVAERFGPTCAAFTGSHEVAHYILHKKELVLHRDAPIRGMERSHRAPYEQEADYFAAVFLVPAKLLRQAVKERFGTDDEIVFDDTTAFKLCGQNPDSILDLDARGRAFAVAGARTFGPPPPFLSLAEYFRVSLSVIAYRLLELAIVNDPRRLTATESNS